MFVIDISVCQAKLVVCHACLAFYRPIASLLIVDYCYAVTVYGGENVWIPWLVLIVEAKCNPEKSTHNKHFVCEKSE